jgi:hypothetical protein
MTRLPKILLGTATALTALTANALAQTPTGDADDTTAPTTSTDPTPATTPTVSTSATEGSTDAWPTAIIERPLTLNAGMVGAAADLSLAHISLGALGSGTSEGIGVAGDYGVNDQITIGAGYALSLHEFEAKGPFDVHAFYRLAHGKLKAAAEAGFGYDLNSEDGDIHAGAHVAYDVAPTFAVYTGGDQLDLGVIRSMDAPAPITLAVPVGVEVQASPNAFLFAQTIVATFGLSNSDNVFISDITPAQVGVFYSPSNTLDIGIGATFLDLQHAGDFYAITATARVFKL